MEKLTPLLKWAGGKRQLLPEILPLIPKEYDTYCEPFMGGGAVFFSIQPQNAVINDYNGEIVNLMRVVRDCPELLISELKKYRNEDEFFYELRNTDRDKEKFNVMSVIEKAARTLYLNRTCFNGLYRVNSRGEFNAPFGRYKNPDFIQENLIRGISSYLSTNNILIMNDDYSFILSELTDRDFVYLDPPYDPVTKTSSFTGYVKNGFGRDEQERLKDECVKLHKNGIRFLLSNSSTDFIKNLYRDFKITEVSARRNINSKGDKRGEVKEVLIRNYT